MLPVVVQMVDKNSDDDKLLDAVFISILNKEPVNSVCSRLKINVNLYNSYKNRIFRLLNDTISFYDNSFTDFLDYVLKISDKESHLSDLDVKIKESEQELKELAKEKKQKTEELKETKKQLSETEDWLKYRENQQNKIVGQMVKINEFESTLKRYNLTLDDLMQIRSRVIPGMLEYKNQIDAEIRNAQATYQWTINEINRLTAEKEKLESKIRSKEKELSNLMKDFTLEKGLTDLASEINKYSKKQQK
jgi:chromosome segregation ATPase